MFDQGPCEIPSGVPVLQFVIGKHVVQQLTHRCPLDVDALEFAGRNFTDAALQHLDRSFAVGFVRAFAVLNALMAEPGFPRIVLYLRRSRGCRPPEGGGSLPCSERI